MSYTMTNGGLLGMGLYGLFGLGAFTGNPTLKPGSTNVALIKKLQIFLGQLKPDGTPDGSFGPKTTTAVAAFQSSHGVPATGIVDAATWAAMDASLAAGAPAAGGGKVTPGAAAPQPCPAGTHYTGMTPQGAQICEQDAATPTVGVGPGQTIDTGPGGCPAGYSWSGKGRYPDPGACLTPVEQHAGGGAASSPLTKAKNWWSGQTTATKGMVVGGVVVGVVLLSMLFGGSSSPPPRYEGTSQTTATPNRRRRRGKKMKKNGRRRRGGRAKGHGRRRYHYPAGHLMAPAKYRRMGATEPSDYAYPAGFMYPIRFHKGRKVKRRTTIKHIRAAAARFGKFSRRYPTTVRKQIRARIQRAERQYHIGRYR